MAVNQLISTMAQPLMVYQGRMVFEAIDPSTGAAVSGVEITNPVVAGVNLNSDAATDQVKDYSPIFVPIVESPGSG